MKTFQAFGYDVVIVRGNNAGSSYSYLIHKDGIGRVASVSLSGPGNSQPTAFGNAVTLAHLIGWAIRQDERSRQWMKDQQS